MSAATPNSGAQSRVPVEQRTLVSIPNGNGTDDTLRCLAALDRQAAPELDFFVLDNGSRIDPTHRFVAEAPDVEFLRQPVNTGFTGGHNRVMQIALDRGYGSVLLLNNDCLIGVEDIRRMRQMLASHPRTGAVSPFIFRADESRKPMMVTSWFDWTSHQTIRPSDPAARQPEGTEAFAVGTALLLRSAALRDIGLLDDRYFAYYEDNDISVRLARAEWLAAYSADASCLHSYRQLHDYGPLSLYLMARNAWLFWREHTPPGMRRGLRRALVARTLHDLALLKKNSAPREKTNAVLAGLWDGARGKHGPPPTTPHVPAWLQAVAMCAPYRLSRLVARLLPARQHRAEPSKSLQA